MKQTKQILAIISFLVITSCSDYDYNIEKSSFSAGPQQSLALATKNNMLKRSLDETEIKEINLWNKTILVVYPSLIFENNSTNFSLSTEDTMHKVISIINNHNNVSNITVTGFNYDSNNQQAQTISAIIWDYARLKNVAISHNNVTHQGLSKASYVNRIEITLE